MDRERTEGLSPAWSTPDCRRARGTVRHEAFGPEVGIPCVLLVEDDPASAQILEALFDNHSDKMLVRCATAAEAIPMARVCSPSIVLLDLRLPDRSGEDLLAGLRSESATAEVPIVVVSADARQESIDRLLAKGASGYLTKPIGLASLLDLVDKLVPPGGHSPQPSEGQDTRDGSGA